MRMELSDLPPRARAQAEQQLAQHAAKRGGDAITAAVKAARSMGGDFDSRGEYEFYAGTVLPLMESGVIVRCELHPRFTLFPEAEYDGVKLRAIRYTADFRLEYADGAVEIVEVKSKFVRRMQRDYPVRRRVFLEQVRAKGWKFREIITTDSKDDVAAWQARAKERA